jgi:hypothetical protein
LGTAPNGNKVWKWTYSGSVTTKPKEIIFSNNGTPQTGNLDFSNGGYYTKDGLFQTIPAGIDNVRIDANADQRVYSLDGRLVSTNGLNQLSRGIYIVNGKKVVIQ